MTSGLPSEADTVTAGLHVPTANSAPSRSRIGCFLRSQRPAAKCAAKICGSPFDAELRARYLSLDRSVYWEVTMRVAKDDVDVKLQIPGAVIRQRTNFGNARGYDDISGEYFTLIGRGRYDTALSRTGWKSVPVPALGICH